MEIPEHSQLLKLEAAISNDITDFGNCHLSETANIQKLNAAIQTKLSQHRALCRELELLVEELDR